MTAQRSTSCGNDLPSHRRARARERLRQACAAPPALPASGALRIGAALLAATAMTCFAARAWQAAPAPIASVAPATPAAPAPVFGALAAALSIATTAAPDDPPGAPTHVPPSVVEPPVVGPPASIAVIEGEPAQFVVQVDPDAPVVLQWERDGSIVHGATGPVLRIAAATLADHGSSWRVRVRHDGGTFVTAPAQLLVDPLGTSYPWR